MPTEREVAHRAVHIALRAGRLVKPNTCESCGSVGIPLEAHHPDYSQPLLIAWLCKPCHWKMPAETFWTQCGICDKAFQAKKKSAKYCSGACRVQAYRGPPKTVYVRKVCVCRHSLYWHKDTGCGFEGCGCESLKLS